MTPTVLQYLQLYRESLELKNLRSKTITGHCARLEKFFMFLEALNLESVIEINKGHITAYQKHRYCALNRYGRSDSPARLNEHLASIKNFFSFLVRDGYIPRDPAMGISRAKEPQRLPKSALDNNEVKKLLLAPDTKTLRGYRDRTIMEVLYSTGIRKTELLNLNVDDIDINSGLIRVNQGKGSKDRIVPVGKIAASYLESYIKAVRPFYIKNTEEQALFVSERRARLKRSAFDQLIKKYAKASGIKKHISTHTFRRSCATEMIKNKANVMHVKDILGHRSLRSIQAYCSLTITDLKEAHKKYHPREKDYT